jgi:Flp pilus assembly protein TadB
VPELELPNLEELEEITAKGFTRRVALTTAIFAVLLAICSLGGSNAMKEMILAQQQASDQWAYYQAKAGREHFYRGQKMRLELDLLEKDTLKPELRQRYEALRQQMTDQEARYAKERQEIEQTARKLEQERDRARSQDPYFDYAEVLLQIAIVMSTVAILSQSRLVFGVAVVAGALGCLLGVNGFFLVVQLPFFS